MLLTAAALMQFMYIPGKLYRNGILACNVNIKRWKIKETDECDLCRLPQTIEHLLFTCRYIAPLWRIVDSVFDINVSFETIVRADDFL